MAKKISTYHQRYIPIFLAYGEMIPNEGYYGTPETKKETSRPLREQPLGPSWSWMSIITPGAIDYRFISGASPAILSSPCCSVIDANSSVMGMNPFGG
jgi:hypothetical protein